MATYRAQLEEDLRWNERALTGYQAELDAAQRGSAPIPRAAEILRDYYQGEVRRLRARLTDLQKEAAMKWDS